MGSETCRAKIEDQVFFQQKNFLRLSGPSTSMIAAVIALAAADFFVFQNFLRLKFTEHIWLPIFLFWFQMSHSHLASFGSCSWGRLCRLAASGPPWHPPNSKTACRVRHVCPACWEEVVLLNSWRDGRRSIRRLGIRALAAFVGKKSAMEFDSDKALKDGAPSTVHAEAEVFKEQKKIHWISVMLWYSLILQIW